MSRTATFISLSIFCLLAISACSPPVLRLDETREKQVAERQDELSRRTKSILEQYQMPLDFSDCVLIALDGSLQIRLARERSELEKEARTRSFISMLPKLIGNGDFTWRSNENAEYSKTVQPKPATTPAVNRYSTSVERKRTTGSIEATWSILDFGLSYFTWRQSYYREVISRYQQQKTRNRIISDVYGAYVLVDVAKKNIVIHEKRLKNAETNLKFARELYESKDFTREQLLLAEEAVRSVEGDIETEKTRLANAKGELLSLLNLSSSAKISINPLGEDNGFDDYDLGWLEKQALLERPELFQKDLERKIDRDEITKAMLRFLPNVSLFKSLHYSTDKYQLHDTYRQAGIRASLDIMGIANRLSQLETAKQNVEIRKTETAVVAAGILLQVRMAYLAYLEARSRYAENLKKQDIEDERRRLAEAKLKAEGLPPMQYREVENTFYRMKTLTNNLLAETKTREMLLKVSAVPGQLGFSENEAFAQKSPRGK